MAEIAVSNRVVARNRLGQFISACEKAATETVKEAVKEGARLSKEMAPTGSKADPRTIPLKESIDWRMTGATSGEWFASARHALAQEFGAGPHVISGDPDLAFYWEEAGRMFVPASQYYNRPGLVTIVNHPGNHPQPYLRPAYEAVMSRVMSIARSNYP